MQHHKHPALAGTLASDGSSIEEHPDAARADAQLVWFPIPDATGREVDALEGLLCVPTRAGAMRVVAVPHVASGLTFGDEVAVADWDGEPLARGTLASGLTGSVRVVVGDGRGWREVAALICARLPRADVIVDVIGEQALAIAVPRRALAGVFELLAGEAEAGGLRWEYVTPERHA
jgi:hypothetical protein